MKDERESEVLRSTGKMRERYEGAPFIFQLILSIVFLFLGLSSPIKCNANETQPFMDAVSMQFKVEKKISLRVDNLIYQYLPIGSSKAELEKFCQSNGLRISLYSKNGKHDDKNNEKISCFARVNFYRNNAGKPIGFGQEVSLYFELTGGKISSALGLIASLHL